MGKKSLERQLPDNEVRAKGGSLRTSARKLNLVAQSIRGKTVARALAELAYSPRRSETFSAYLFGIRGLFNDSFAGDGVFATCTCARNYLAPTSVGSSNRSSMYPPCAKVSRYVLG